MVKFIVNLTPMLSDLGDGGSAVGSQITRNGETVYIMATRDQKLYREMMGADAVPVITPSNVEARKAARNTDNETERD